MAEKNELVDQTMEQKDPYKAKGSDWKVENVKAGTGQSGSHGFAEGHNELAKQSHNQESPRDVEGVDDGPSVWAQGGKEFKVGKNSEGGKDVDISEGVDLLTGKITCKGYSETKVDEVAEKKVSIG